MPSQEDSPLNTRATAPPEPKDYLDDPRRHPLEINIAEHQGPRLFRHVTVWMERLIAVLLIVLILSVAANVIGRSLLNHSLPWADELARMLFIWTIFIGAAAAFARYEHIAVDFLVRRLPPRAAYALYGCQHLIITALMGVVILGGYQVMSRSTGRTAILGVPWNLINASVVLCASFIALVAIWRAWKSFSLMTSPETTYPDTEDS